MKYQIHLLFGSFFAALIVGGWLWAVFAVIGLVLLAIKIKGYLYRLKLEYYGDRLENFYVWQQSPTDKKVVVRAQKHEHWLKLSGNDVGVRVVTIFYQDSLNPNEEYEEYLERVKETIALDRAVRHQEIEQKLGRDYYLREVHGQKGIRLAEEDPLPPSRWEKLREALAKHLFTSQKSKHEKAA